MSGQSVAHLVDVTQISNREGDGFSHRYYTEILYKMFYSLASLATAAILFIHHGSKFGGKNHSLYPARKGMKSGVCNVHWLCRDGHFNIPNVRQAYTHCIRHSTVRVLSLLCIPIIASLPPNVSLWF